MTRTSRLSLTGFWMALVSGALIILSPLGYRIGLLSVRQALLYLLPAALLLSVVALIISLVAALQSRRKGPMGAFRLANAGILLALAFASFLAAQTIKARSSPRIHDITTDTVNPPQFVALAGPRNASPNGLEYGGIEVARQQQQAYQDIVPFQSRLPAGELFARAEAAVRDLDWEIAVVVPTQGRIEATATTRLYGFRDDIVIRVQPHEPGSRLDMRSMSRIGVGDLGANAARVRAFLARLKESGA